MPITVSLPSRNVELEFPDSMTEQEIQAAIEQEYPRSGEDVAFEVEQANQQSLEGAVTVNPFEGENKMSRDDYLLLQEYKASKKSSLGDLLGIATDVAGQVFSDVGKGLTEAGAAALVGEFSPAVQSAAEGIAAGTVGMYDIGKRILNPKKNIPTKEEFLKGRVPTGEIISRPDTGTGIVGQVGQIQYRPATEQDYNDLIDSEMQKDAEAVNRLYLMEDIIRGAPIEEIARGASYADATTLASLGAGAAAKLGAKTLFKAGGGQLARTAPGAVGQAALTAAEKTAGAVQGVTSVPGRVINKVGEVVGQVFPGGAPAAKATAVTGAVIGDMGVSLGTAAATEKAAELAGTAARLAKGEKARAGLLERIALNPDVNPITRKIAAGAAQFSPAYYAAGTLLKEGAKGAAVGSAVGAGLGYLAERNLEGAAAGAGAGFAIGGMAGTLRSSFDLGREMVGISTSRTRQQATGDINRFIAERPAIEQAAWAELANTLSSKVGFERAAAQMDALKIAEANGANIRLATAAEMKKWRSPGWVDSTTNKAELVLNPQLIRSQTAAHETSHVLFGSLLNRAFKSEVEQAVFGVVDPQTGNIVRPGIFDDVALANISAQIAKSYSSNKGQQSVFRGYAKTLASSTDKTKLAKARSAITDELVAVYTEKMMGRLRPGQFNPDRLPLLYRRIFDNIDESVRNAFGTVLFEKGMNLRFDNTTKTFKNADGKTIRIPELDALIKNAFSRPEVRAARAAKAKPDLIPVSVSDRAVWARSYGGAKGILNDDLTPKSMDQINNEALRRWQDKTQRLSALPDTEKIGLEFTTDKNGQTVVTARGQLSQAAIDIITKGDALDDSAEAVLRNILNSWQSKDKSTFDTRYYGVYDRGKGSNKMVAGVKSASQNEILPYSIEANSKDGIIIRAVDMTKVRSRLATAMNKPQFKSLYSNPADALKDFNLYLDNLSNPIAAESSAILGAKGALKRDMFYDALGFRLRSGENLTNIPQSIINKSQNTIKSYRVERFAKLEDSGFSFPFEEGTTYERAMRNFQPDAFTKETLPNGEAMTNPDGYRILKKTGSSLFRVYDDKGELIGVAKNELGAMRMAQRKFIDGWHGSPHNFMRFMTQKIGTGEGVQAFGYGLYIAENRKIAEQYKKDLSGYEELTIYTKDGKKKGNALDDLDLEASKYLESGERAAGQFKHNTVYYAKQQAEKAGRMDIVERIESYGRDARTGYEINRGSLYRVQLNVLPEQLLDWDKPLSEQSEGVKAFMNRAAEKVPFDGIIKNADGTLEQDASGRMLYEWLTKQQKGTNKESQVSNLLSKNGIPGIRYLDQGSRATGEGTSNYVIFDEGLIRILDRNGKPVGKRLFRDVAEEGYNVRFQPDDTAKKTTKEEKQTGFQPSEFRFQPDDPNNTADAKAAQNTLKTTYFKNQEEFQKAVAEGRVRKANIEDFIGKVVALHQPDNAMVGTVEFNGTTVVVGEGGVYYAVKFGKDGSLWASTKTAAEKTAKALNEIHDANNGKIYMGLTSAPVTKLFSSTNMATGIVDTLAEVSKLSKEYGMTESALNGIITKASKVPFVKKKNGEIVSESRLKVNLDEKNSLNENLSLLRDVLKPENSSFDNRTTFSGAIANNLAVFFKDKPKESAKFASLILGDSNKYAKASIRKGKLSKDAILQAFGDMFSEGFLKDFQSAKGSGHLYAVLEMDGRVESVHSPNHKSYPFTVKSTSGKKPVVHILDKAMPWQDVVGLAGQKGYVPKELKKSVYPTSGFSTTKHGHLEVRKPREGAVPTLTNIMFQPDPASPNILNGSNGTRIIKSPSGKFRVYSVTGTLLGIRDTEQAAKKLATK